MGSLTNLRERGVGAALGIMFTGLVVSGSFSFFKESPKAPHEQLAMRVLTPVITMGEPVIVRASGVRNRMCVVFLARSIKDLGTGYTVMKEIVPGGFAPMGVWSEDVRMKLPSDMGPGDYELRVIQNNDCGEEVYPLSFPPVVFRVISQQ